LNGAIRKQSNQNHRRAVNMQVFDLKEMKSFAYEERDKNVFYKTEEFKVRFIEIPPGGKMPSCEMASYVIFNIIEGSVEVQVNQKNTAIKEGQCLITAPATMSMKTEDGVKIMGIQIERK
jgi:quercetin dioxygenase-like cupin family protein